MSALQKIACARLAQQALGSKWAQERTGAREGDVFFLASICTTEGVKRDAK